MDLGLAEKVGLVTGASVGIGRGIAQLLGSEGLQLVLVARRHNLLTSLSTEIQRSGGKEPLLIPADLTDIDVPERIRDAVLDRFGRLDVLVHNAGKSTSWFRPPVKPGEQRSDFSLPEKDWRASFAINFEQIRRLTDAFLPSMIEGQFGRIVLVSGIWEPERMSLGLSAKAAAAAWAKGLSREVARHGITINVIPVGKINSEQLHNKVLLTEEDRLRVAQAIPARRLGDPIDVAHAVAFFASVGSCYVTGQNLAVDGGMSKFAF